MVANLQVTERAPEEHNGLAAARRAVDTQFASAVFLGLLVLGAKLTRHNVNHLLLHVAPSHGTTHRSVDTTPVLPPILELLPARAHETNNSPFVKENGGAPIVEASHLKVMFPQSGEILESDALRRQYRRALRNRDQVLHNALIDKNEWQEAREEYGAGRGNDDIPSVAPSPRRQILKHAYEM